MASKQETNDVVTKALKAARIPLSFIKAEATLKPYERDGNWRAIQMLRIGLNDKSLHKKMSEGKVITLVENKARADKFSVVTAVTYLTARALVLGGVGVRCYALPDLADQIESNRAWLESSLEGVKNLAVPGFYESRISKNNPYGPRLASKLTWFLYQWLADGHSLITSSQVSGGGLFEDWWPISLLDMINEKAILQISSI